MLHFNYCFNAKAGFFQRVSNDVEAAILVYENNKMGNILMYKVNPLACVLFPCENTFLCLCTLSLRKHFPLLQAAYHESKNILMPPKHSVACQKEDGFLLSVRMVKGCWKGQHLCLASPLKVWVHHVQPSTQFVSPHFCFTSLSAFVLHFSPLGCSFGETDTWIA